MGNRADADSGWILGQSSSWGRLMEQAMEVAWAKDSKQLSRVECNGLVSIPLRVREMEESVKFGLGSSEIRPQRDQ